MKVNEMDFKTSDQPILHDEFEKDPPKLTLENLSPAEVKTFDFNINIPNSTDKVSNNYNTNQK